MIPRANHRAAEVLFNVATMLELAEDNPYRIRAYRQAARNLLRTRQDILSMLTDEGELALPGIGVRLRRQLGELVATGRMGFYVELCGDLPPAVESLMTIPGVGPKTAHRLSSELDLASPEEVVAAAEAGNIRALAGFGPRSEANLRAAAAALLRRDAGVITPFTPPVGSPSPALPLPFPTDRDEDTLPEAA
ncbi:MAG: hypothetical protein AVDCRST_MAG70-1989 [uncultured Thermomicrobiales bacterium]|uniref:Crossover junction endonuclease MUS81-like HHH domain-containing protein n=1 Tax=uncultured Thermomicrobiales bacterium TaxID=1645740 RepID=A0A6J4V1G0_9BACT|nr:MAG: hypothetical protein AVDCRST_MAG70-1989 [uncultured Thermomicrobiales bacterium]